MLEAIRTGFLRTHMNMQKVAEHWPLTSLGFPCTAGTTVTCAFIRNGKLYMGHVGDSSIVLANFMEQEAGYNDAKLTDDHKPETQPERQRIEQAGGAVATKSGIVRVIWKRPARGHRGPVRRSTSTENIPFLAVARSLGDFWSLNPDNNQYVVSPVPDVDVFRLKSSDNFVVISSDGLTNVVGVRDTIQLLRNIEGGHNNQHSLNRPTPVEDVHMIDPRFPLNHAQCLLQLAFKKWGNLRADNISIICIKLNAPEVSEAAIGVIDQDLHMDVGQQLVDHPFSIIHVNKISTLRLNTNPLRHIYTGTLDKGFNLARFGRIVNENGAGNKQRNNQQNQELFLGPGFIVPEMLSADDVSSGIGSRSSLYEAANANCFANGESDAEELKTVKSTTLPAAANTSEPPKKGHGSPSQSISTQNQLQKGNKRSEEVVPKSPLLRAGMKRRLDDRVDGTYTQHSMDSAQPGPSAKKISLEEEQEEDDHMRPPHKRSRLQTVLSFFSSFFKW